MKTKQQIVLVAFSVGFLIFLILAFDSPTTHDMSNRNVVVRARPQPLSLKTLARVVRYCEENDKPMHPGIVRWASASLTTDANQLAQTNRSTEAGLFRSEYK
jgi:hypothetical protein